MFLFGKFDNKKISIVVEVIGDYLGGKVLINGAIIFVLFIPVLYNSQFCKHHPAWSDLRSIDKLCLLYARLVVLLCIGGNMKPKSKYEVKI